MYVSAQMIEKKVTVVLLDPKNQSVIDSTAIKVPSDYSPEEIKFAGAAAFTNMGKLADPANINFQERALPLRDVTQMLESVRGLPIVQQTDLVTMLSPIVKGNFRRADFDIIDGRPRVWILAASDTVYGYQRGTAEDRYMLLDEEGLPLDDESFLTLRLADVAKVINDIDSAITSLRRLASKDA